MAYRVTITFLVDAESEDVLERYMDRLAYDIAQRETFFLDNREIEQVDTPVEGRFRTLTADDLPYVGP
jgi:hypothetical protein